VCERGERNRWLLGERLALWRLRQSLLTLLSLLLLLFLHLLLRLRLRLRLRQLLLPQLSLDAKPSCFCITTLPQLSILPIS
jgi:hypothetical protein